LTEDPDRSCVEIPVDPALCIVNEIRLIAPSAVGSEGTEPDGNRKYVENPTVVVPLLTILRVCDSPSKVPPVTSIVTVPVQVTL